jgi:hypothetical protein
MTFASGLLDSRFRPSRKKSRSYAVSICAMITLSRQLSSAHSERGIDNMNNKRTSRNFFAVVLLTFAAIGATTGSQCARVDDSATGPNSEFLNSSGTVTGCVQDCNEQAREARRAENERFHLAFQACSSSDCKSQQVALHQAALEQINADQEACKSGCHEQGRGRGGN